MSNRLLVALALCALAGRAGAIDIDEFVEKQESLAPPVLEASPLRLTKALHQGETGVIGLTVRNAGGRMMNWSARATASWVRVSEPEGSLGFREEHALTVTLEPVGLAPGLHRAEIVVEAPGAGHSPVSVAIVLELTPEERKPTPDVETPSPDAPGPVHDQSARHRRFGRRRVVTKAQPEEVPPDGEAGEGVARSVAEAPEPAARGEFGLRLAYVAPMAGDDESFLGGPAGGVYYRMAHEGRLGLEFSLDYGSNESDAVDATSRLLTVGAAAMYRPNPEAVFYVLGGGRILSEWVEDRVFETTTTGLGATLDVGGGVTLAQGRMDLRATCSLLLGSGNVRGLGGVAVGYSF